MFDNLSGRLSDAARQLTGKGRLTENNIKDTLRQVRLALLEADVALPVVKTFIERIRERALGEEVGKSLTPGQALVKIIHAELVRILGSDSAPLDLRAQPPVVILLAGLQSLPKEPIEAAKIDGATGWQTFRHVVLPMLRPLLFTVLIIRSIDTLKVFDIVFGTTGGGPGLATEVMQTFAYRTAYSFLQISRAMTIMVIFAALVTALCFVYMRAEKLR